MGTCYSTNKLETNNSSIKRPYEKSNQIQNCHQLITPSYLATISNNKLITINNQTYDLKPKKKFHLNGNNSKNQIKMSMNEINSVNKNKSISKLPKFSLNRQIHDSSKSNITTINHFGTKIVNNDILKIKNNFRGLGSKNSKSSNSSLSNSETSCGSTLSTNSIVSNNSNSNITKKLTYKKPSLISTSSSVYKSCNYKKPTNLNTNNKIISTQPIKNENNLLLNDGKDKIKYVNKKEPLFNQANTKLPTSKFTTLITNIPKPQIAERVNPKALNQINHDSVKNKNSINYNLYQNGLDNQKSLRPLTLKNTNENFQPYKRPVKLNLSNQESKLNYKLHYPLSESNLKNKITYNSLEKQTNKSFLPAKKLHSYSGLPQKSIIKTSKSDLNNWNDKNSQDKISSDTVDFINHQNSKSLTNQLDKNLSSDIDNKKLTNSLDSSIQCSYPSQKENTLIPRVFNKSNFQQKNLNISTNLIKKDFSPIRKSSNESNTISLEDANNSNLSSSPELSSNKITPEHNRTDFLIDDEICDQPDLMFLNSKENNCNGNLNSPIKDEVNQNEILENIYKTNLRYSISELDSLKLKQELLMSSSLQMEDEKNFCDNSSNDLASSNENKNSQLPTNSMIKTFRKPRPLSVVESVNGSLALDGSSFRSIMQDIHGIKTLLFRLQGEVQKSETQNPFENILNASMTKNQNLSNSLNTKDNVNEFCFTNENLNLEAENENLKKQVAILQQQMEEKDRTIRLLQQQMTKYLNINETTGSKKTSNATTQTDRISDFKNIAPESTTTKNNLVVSFFIRNHSVFRSDEKSDSKYF